MTKNFETSYILADFLLNNYKPVSKADNERADYCRKLLDAVKREGYMDAGVMGKVLEVVSRPSNSELINVQPSSRVDSLIEVEGQLYRLEVKSNGGRLGDLERLSKYVQQHTLIHYTLLMRTPQGKPRKDGTCRPAEVRYADVIMRLDKFLALLKSKDATKHIEHKDYITSDRELAIQADSKKLYNALLKETRYNRNKAYVKADFDL